MLKTIMKTIVSASFCFVAIAPASAAPMTVQKPAIQNSAEADVVQIRHERRGFYRDRDRGYYNGHRGYREQRRGYRQYNGFWFPPAAFSFGIIIDGANRGGSHIRPGYTNPQHISWCHNRYRSYDQRSNTFQPNHGPRRECRSPYYLGSRSL